MLHFQIQSAVYIFEPRITYFSGFYVIVNKPRRRLKNSGKLVRHLYIALLTIHSCFSCYFQIFLTWHGNLNAANLRAVHQIRRREVNVHPSIPSGTSLSASIPSSTPSTLGKNESSLNLNFRRNLTLQIIDYFSLEIVRFGLV